MRQIFLEEYKISYPPKALELLVNKISMSLDLFNHKVTDIKIDNISRTVMISFECNDMINLESDFCPKIEELRNLFHKGFSKI